MISLHSIFKTSLNPAILIFQLFMCLVVTFAHAEDDGPSVRIVGGVTSTEAYPWMVSIQRIPNDGSFHFCGGTLIGKDWVLTAAHCLDDDTTAEDLEMFIGAIPGGVHNLGEARSAEWIMIHPDYDSESQLADIALIKLSISSSKAPIKLLNQASSAALMQNDTVRTMGWGVTEEGNWDSLPSQLREVDLKLQADSVCQATYGESSEYWELFICAGEVSGGKDSCQGDSGGPLVVQANGEWAQAGIVSWGDGCGVAEKYGAYTKVAKFLSWIEQRRGGVNMIGVSKMGFVGLKKTKPATFQLFNYAEQAVVVNKKFVTGAAFEVDPDNWRLDSIPAKHKCEFVINASGSTSGEYNDQLLLDTGSLDPLKFNLNIKVLNSLDINTSDSLDVNWTFFSGSTEVTGFTSSWGNAEEITKVNSSVLKSGVIDHGQQSVLLTYLSGSGNTDAPHHLKFDAKVNSAVIKELGDIVSIDFLDVYVNEEFRSNDLYYASKEDGSWVTYAVKLEQDINHVKFAFNKDDENELPGEGGFLDNLRVCTDISDLGNEASCSSVDGFSSVGDQAASDDLPVSAVTQDVCTAIDYSDDDIVYANTIPEVIVPQSSGSGGGSLYWLLMLVPLFAFRLNAKK